MEGAEINKSLLALKVRDFIQGKIIVLPIALTGATKAQYPTSVNVLVTRLPDSLRYSFFHQLLK